MVRPLRPEDIGAVDLLARDAFGGAGPEAEAARARRGHARIAHLREQDPAGSWAAVDDDGTVHGASQAIVREGVWGLALLVVRPDAQSRGIGGALLDAALAYGDGARGGLIVSSTDPRAMRRYARAGFSLRPTVAAAGIVDRAALPPSPGVRPGGPVDIPATAPVSRAVRGAAHVRDLPPMLAAGSALLVHERGFAVHDAGSTKVLAARDDAAATELLSACLAASAPGSTVHVDCLTAGQDWAVRTVLDAGLDLSPDGPLFARGELGPLHPYLPSGAYL